MRRTVNVYAEKVKKARRSRRWYAAALVVLAAVTVLGVNWTLHQKGLSMTPEYTCGLAEHQHTEDCYTEELICGQEEGDGHQHTDACYERTLTCGLPEHVHTADCLAAQPDAQSGGDTPVVQADNTEADMSSYLTAMTGSGTKYDANGNLYKSDLRLDFSIPADTVNAKKDYYYDYPVGIIVPDGLLDKTYDLYDGANNKAGTYYFTKNDNGTYRVHVDFLENYNPTKDPVTGYISFAGEVDGSKGNDDGSISIKGSDNVTLDIPKNQITYPDGETNRYEIKTSKTGTYSKDGKLTYTVYVYSLKGTPGNISFEDTITASGLALGDPTVKVEQETVTRRYNPDNGGYNPDGDSFTSQEIDQSYVYTGGKLTMTLPKIEPATHYAATDKEWEKDVYTRYKVTYTFDVSDITDNAFTDNKVSTVSSNNNTTVKAEAEKHLDVKTTVEDNVTKTGVGGGGVDYISWTITVNKNQDGISGATLRDEMLKKLIPGHFTINPDKGYDFVYDKDGKLIGLDFKDDGSGTNTNTYTITYRTPAQSNWNNGEGGPVTNTVDFTHGDKTDSATGTVDQISAARVDKTMNGATESADGKTATVTWTVKMTVPADKLPAGTVIMDDPTKDIYGNSGGPQYRTRQQALDWASGIYWASYGHDGPEKINDDSLPKLTDSKVATIEFLGSDGKQYTLAEVEASKDDTLTYTVATITLKQDLVTPANATYLMFHYTTTADITEATTSGTNYYNTASVGNIKGGDIYTYTKSGITKTDEEGSTDKTAKVNEDGSLTWKISVTLGKAAKKLTITDTLPDGVTLESISGEDKLTGLSATIENGTVSSAAGSYKVSGTYQKNTLILDITGDLTSGQYTLVVNCKVDTDVEGYKAGTTYTFKNSASAKVDGTGIGSADQTQDWTEDVNHEGAKIVDKSGGWDNNNRRFKYTIKLNPYGKDIVEGSETLTLKDVFKYYPKISGHPIGDYSGTTEAYDLNAWLVPDSVKLYKGIPDGQGGLTRGEEIADWRWTVTTGDGENGLKTSTLVGTNLPDSTPLILEYDYQLESQMPADYETNAGAYTVSNNAQLTGTDYKDSQTGSEVNWGKQETTGAVTSDIVGTLYKVAKGSYGKTLPGAVFKLQRYDTTSSSYVDEGVTYTTDENGRITIQWQKNDSDVLQYEHNVLYRVVETEPPTGYEMPSDPVSNAFYFYFSSAADTDNTLPTDLPDSAADLSKASKTVYVENESSSTEITVNKKWLDANGNQTTHTSGSIQVQLYQVASAQATGTATLNGKIMASSGGLEWEWQAITAQEHPAGTTVSFTIISYAGAPEIKVNNMQCTPVVEEIGWGGSKYTYTFTLTGGDNVVSGTVPFDGGNSFSGITVTEPDNTGSDTPAETPTGTLYRTYDITADDSWTKTISDLPVKGKDANGNTVYYTYYVEEVGNANYDVSYDNNDGIASGTITVTNRMSDSPSYELPATGGIGTHWFTLGGIAAMSTAALMGCVHRRRRKREVN